MMGGTPRAPFQRAIMFRKARLGRHDGARLGADAEAGGALRPATRPAAKASPYEDASLKALECGAMIDESREKEGPGPMF
jgi:hypothetical protein